MSRRVTDPGWPIGYPSVATQAFSAPTVPGTVTLAVGNLGKVTRYDPENGVVCVQFPRDAQGRQGAEGWVPISRVNIGEVKKVGEDLWIDVKEPDTLQLANGIYFDHSGLLIQTVSGHLSAYYNHRSELPTEPTYISQVLKTDDKVRQLTMRIVQGVGRVSGKLRNALDSRNFTVFDLRDASVNGDNDDHTGIYGILYWDFVEDDPQHPAYKVKRPDGRPKPTRQPEFYIGSTAQSFKIRSQQHRDAARDPDSKSNHYKAARAAKRRANFPISYMTNIDDESGELKLAEQVFLNLFEVYSPAVLNFMPGGFIGEDEEEEDAGDNKLSRVSRYIIHKEEAYLLKDLSKQVAARTGWPGGIDRQSFGAAVGLNWRSPLTEMQTHRTIWVKTVSPDGFVNFRRTDFHTRLYKSTRRSVVVFDKYYTGYDRQFAGIMHWAAIIPGDEPHPPPDTQIHVIFEVRLDETIHPASLSRSPSVGCFSDWNNSNKIALRIEWQDDRGNWWYRYVQMGSSGNLDERLNVAPNGGTQGYNVATGLRSFLLQERRQLATEFRNWMWDFGIARVKEVYLDYLDQAIRIRNVHNPHDVPGPAWKDIDTVGQELVSKGAGRYSKPTDAQYPRFPGGHGRSDQNRVSCDTCFSIAVVRNKPLSSVVCTPVAGENICVRCKGLRKPCTFTHTRALTQNTEYIRAVTNPSGYTTTPARVQNDKMYQY